MRHLSLTRSHTVNDIDVSIDLYQSPLIIYGQTADDHVNEDDRQDPSRLGLTVNVSCQEGRHAGGIVLVRKVLLKRRIPQSKLWGPWEELQSTSIELAGECWLQGNQRFECAMPLSLGLPETRQTHYDQVSHVLFATVLDPAPTYNVATSSKPAFDRFHSDPHLRTRRPLPRANSTHDRSSRQSDHHLAIINEDDPSSPADRDDRGHGGHSLASCRKVFQVVHCQGLPGDVPRIEWGQNYRLSDTGKVSVGIHSDLFVLGSRLDVVLAFSSLTADTTIHAVSAKLIQETCTPTKALAEPAFTDVNASVLSNSSPSLSRTLRASTRSDVERRNRGPVSRLSTFLASLKEKPPLPKSSILDEYLLHTEGADHVVTPQGFRLRHGACLWRGEAGRQIDADRVEHPGYKDDSKASHLGFGDWDRTERTTSTMSLNRRLRLPSEINSACPSSIISSPVLARVTHRIEVDVIYSVLGQDRLGRALESCAGSEVVEGELRLSRAIVEVGLLACTITPSIIRPPSYFVPSSREISERLQPLHRCGSIDGRSMMSSDVQPSTPSAMVPHTRAFRASNGVVIGGKKVFYAEGELLDSLSKHCKDVGECACGIMWDGLGRIQSGSA